MKYSSIVILFLFISSVCESKPATSSNYSKTIKKQAEFMLKLFMDKDIKDYSKFIYPKIIEMAGGEDEIIKNIESGISNMDSNGVSFLHAKIGEPSRVVAAGNELQCTLSQIVELKVESGKLVTQSTLIAISSDGGKNWFFIDTSSMDIKIMQEALPNLSSELVIPEKQKPEFHKD